MRMNPSLSAVPRDSEKRGSKSHLAVNSGIHVGERRGSRNAMEKQLTDRTILIKDPSGQIVPYEVVGSSLRESVFKKSVPILHPAIAALFCFLNVVPGFGTFLASFTLLCGAKSSFKTWHKGFLVGTGTAVLQLLTSFLLFGWCWSIMHGVHFIQKANEIAKNPVREKEEEVII